MSHLTIPQDIRRLSRRRAPDFYKLLNAGMPDRIEVGQIWSTYSCFELPDGRHFETEDPRLVVILDGAGSPSQCLDQIAVAPLSLSTSMAAQFDLLVSEDRSPLGFDVMVETWNETPAVKGQLKQFLGKLSPEALSVLHSLYAAQLVDEPAPARPTNWTGPRIMDERDPRLAFQEAEIRAVEYLSKAATASLMLREAVHQDVGAEDSSASPRRVFKLPLVLDRLSSYMRNAPAMSYAADMVSEERTSLVSYSDEEEFFTFEILSSRRPPYRVYVIIHQVSSTFEQRKCIVTLKIKGAELQSMPTKLEEGKEIQLGEDKYFSPDQVQSVQVEIV